ncbi:MAG: hypothetical protein ABI140_17920 [Jatrophihabitantaceae bacterium]
MTCDRYREAASARLDGEPIAMSATALEHHLSACADCAGWLADAERASRAFRVSGLTAPDLSAEILREVVLPAGKLARRRQLLRTGLFAVGFIQWALAMPALFGQNVAMQAATAMGAHAAHESAAWNLAMGASFVAVAVKPARAIGALPILATFVIVLSVLSVPDVLAGAVETARLAGHAGVLAGLILVALMSRFERLPAPGAGRWAAVPGPAAATDQQGRGAA